jgi:hypothetical protein
MKPKRGDRAGVANARNGFFTTATQRPNCAHWEWPSRTAYGSVVAIGEIGAWEREAGMWERWRRGHGDGG